MRQWEKAVQQVLDWIEDNIMNDCTLLDMSRQIGYSPYYCSSRFHAITGKTIRSYVAGRKLSHAAIEIRDTHARILDIAVKYGFSSQEAFTRAFKTVFGCTPAAYRKHPQPIPLTIKKNVLFPDNQRTEGEDFMCNTIRTEPRVKMEYIPAHKYIGIWDREADSYFGFWENHDCDEVCGTIDSMSNEMHPVVIGHTAGWFHAEKGKRGYFYGLGVPADYNGKVPEGYEIREVPESYYLVFYHPPFDFLKDCEDVMNSVEQLAWNYDCQAQGYRWNEDECPCYQRHWPETLGYEVLRPVKKIK